MNSVLKNTPAVFAVGKEYKIFIPTAESCVVWVKIKDECY